MSWFLYMVWDKGTHSFFCMCISSFTNTVYWRLSFPHCVYWHSYQTSGNHENVDLFLGSLFYSVGWYVCFYACTILFWLLLICNIFWNQEVWNANQNHNEIITSHMLWWLLWKRQKITSVGDDVKKREFLYILGGNVNWYSHFRKQYEVPQKIKNRTTISPSNSTSGYISKGN